MKKNSTLQLEYDDARKLELIAAKRAARAAAIHDPNRRNISVDPAQCEALIQEKQSRRDLEKKAEQLAALEARRINRLIAQAEMEEADRRKEAADTVRASWKGQSDRRDRIEADLDVKLNPPAPVVPETCGLSAGQCFEGEDRNRFERKRLQARQIALWSQQQIDEKAARAVAEKQEGVAYARYIDEIDKLRDQMEKEDMLAGAGARLLNREANLRLAKQQRNLKEKAFRDEKERDRIEIAAMANDPFINEQPKYFTTRPDFKGFSAAERAQMKAENDQVLKEQREAHSDNKDDEKMWVRQFVQMNKEISKQEIEAQERAAANSKAVQMTHRWQMQEAQARERKNAEDARGEIGGGFFAQFGNSHR